MNLLPHLLLKHLKIEYNMSYLLDACQIGQAQKKTKKSQTLQKIVSKFIQSERPFEPHPKVS